MFQNKDHVFPGKDRIAARIDASVRTVSNALKKFQELGLLTWVKRGHRSNVYIFDEIFKQIDLDHIDEFLDNLRENCRTNCRLYSDTSLVDIHVHTSPAAHVPKSLKKLAAPRLMSFEDLPHQLKQPFMKAFDFANFGWQLKLLPEVGQQEIIENMRWYAREQVLIGKPIKNMDTWCKIFTSMMRKWIFKEA